MNCSETNLLLSLYLSSELAAPEMAAFELHVQQCRACARKLGSARDCDDLLRDAFAQQSLETRELRKRISREIRKSDRRRFTFDSPLVRAAIAAAIVLAFATVFYFVFFSGSSQTVYAAARDDHYVEVVQRDPRPWLETPAGIKDFVRAELGDPEFLDRFAPSGYELKRALHCYLQHQRYVHLVYANGTQEISIYVGLSAAKFQGSSVEVANGCALYAAELNPFAIAGFRSQKYTVLVVSQLPRAENLKIARETALRLTQA